MRLAGRQVNGLGRGRYSARQRTRVTLGPLRWGRIVERVTDERRVAPSSATFEARRADTVGKGATFGLGGYVPSLQD